MNDVLEEALCAHEGFRKLDYPPEQIFIEALPDGAGILSIAALARAPGRLDVKAPCGTWRGTLDEFRAAWGAAVEKWNVTGDDEWRTRIWEHSMMRANAVNVALALEKANAAKV